VEGPLTGGDTTRTPAAIIDGGGEPWERLGVAIARRMEQLGAGDVLEVVSDERRARADVPSWCYLAGYDLLWMAVEKETARFWIRKRAKEDKP
jgi:TusA-related sulfurtransferase